MQQKTSKPEIAYVLVTLSSVLFIAIFGLFYLHLKDGNPPIAVPLGLTPIAILNMILGASMLSKSKP
jgi:hypothetical protein